MGYVEACVFMLFIATLSSFTIGDPQVPCYFRFADSLYDNDNNNDLVTEAKVNFPPYGVDLPDGPTGRFSKGRNIADVIGGGRISLNQQIAHHAIIILQLIDLIRKGSVAPVQEHLNKCIYTVAMGNNDFINNYFFPQYYNTSSLYTPEEYAEILVQQYSEQLSIGTLRASYQSFVISHHLLYMIFRGCLMLRFQNRLLLMHILVSVTCLH
ncbi:putative triacylglycerol lipase [Helianthus annuus]|nr:putative triacylglycerol lipase [Helianthus annuus]